MIKVDASLLPLNILPRVNHSAGAAFRKASGVEGVWWWRREGGGLGDGTEDSLRGNHSERPSANG